MWASRAAGDRPRNPNSTGKRFEAWSQTMTNGPSPPAFSTETAGVDRRPALVCAHASKSCPFACGTLGTNPQAVPSPEQFDTVGKARQLGAGRAGMDPAPSVAEEIRGGLERLTASERRAARALLA